VIRTRLGAVFACVGVLLMGCGAHVPGHGPAPSAAALKADYSGDGPGTLIAANILVDLDPLLRAQTSLAARIVYVSTSGINDSHPHVTATVFVPKGDPPAGGWPVVALGHPATGIQPDCAPSESPTLLGMMPAVSALIDAGYLVTVPDYQGLGLRETYHPFLDSTTEGFNLIDSVKAVRRLVPSASDAYAVWGSGQGGQAAWAADELATDYSGQTKLVGAVAIRPTAALEWLADAAAADGLNRDQLLMLQQILASLKAEYNEFDLDAYRRGVAKDGWNILTACWGDAVQQRSRVIDQIGPDDLRPDGPEATDALRAYLQKTSLPQAPAAAPMVVSPDDDDTGLIPRAQTDAAVARACVMGDVIDFGAPQIDDASVIGWLADRFAGNPAHNDCDGLPLVHS
jgi:Secretory lipase